MSYEFIEKAAPEEVGISSLWIEAFLKRLRDIGYDIHSFQIIRNGKLVFAKAAEPYALTDGHRLLSAAKPIIALAVLFAIDEGKLSFDDKVVDYFQDMVPEDVDERMKKMTLYDLITMQTGQNRDDAFMHFLTHPDTNLCQAFFNTPMDTDPGSVFFYNNSVPHLLFFMVERATGEPIVSYLKRKVCEPLDMSIEAQYNSEGIYDPVTTVVSPEDFLKLALFFYNHGKWNDEQLIDEKLMKMATTQQTWTGNTDEGYRNNKGYCMQIWCNAFGGTRMDGGGGQLAFLLPENDMIATIMGNEGRVDTAIQYFYEEIYSKLSGRKLVESADSRSALENAKHLLNRAPIDTRAHSELEKSVSGKVYRFEENSFDIKEIELCFEEEKVTMRAVTGAETKAFCSGLVDGWLENKEYFAITPDTSIQNMIYGFDENECFMSSGWKSDDEFLMVLKSKASMGEYRFKFKWENENNLVLHIPGGVSAGMKEAAGESVIKGTV